MMHALAEKKLQYLSFRAHMDTSRAKVKRERERERHSAIVRVAFGSSRTTTKLSACVYIIGIKQKESSSAGSSSGETIVGVRVQCTIVKAIEGLLDIS